MSNLLLNVHRKRCKEIETKKGSSSNQNSNITGSDSNQSSGSTGSSQTVTISSSVGLRSTNFQVDVRSIQNALNRIHPGYGGPATPLVPDGTCGQKTVDAIQKFQLHHFGWNGADGKINPNGETLAKINEVLSRPQNSPPQVFPPDAPEVNEALDKTMNVYLLEARRWIHETRYELMALEPFINSPIGMGASYERLNNIFAIGKSHNRKLTLRKILQVFNDMESAFQRHDAGENPVFELYKGKATGTTSTGATIAFTCAAGFYRNSAEIVTWEYGNYRLDKIYLMPSGIVFASKLDLRFYISVLIHELAHFVGGWHSVGTIEDWNDEGTLLERLRAANCYQRYAEAVHFRTNGK